jgi:outer membrane protein assembly factor BamA
MKWPLAISVHIAPIAIALVFLCVPASPALAQSKQSIIAQINTEGASRLSTPQIVAASGLKPGQPADDSILTAALDRLSKTGAFTALTYRYSTSNGKMVVTLLVTEEPKTLPCTFDNFVWLTSEEIGRAIRAEVPLYDGRVPVDGDLPQDVATALEHLLAQHHIKTAVGYIASAKSIGSPPTEYRYSAKENLPPVTSVEFVGGPLDPSQFAVAKQRLMGHGYSAAYSHALAENDLDVTYHNQAYLQARFSDPQVTFQPGASDSDPGSVKLVFTVVPGPVYAWHGADWNGNTVYATPDLDRLLAMKEGDIAAMDKITAGMEAIHAAYGQKGYLAVSFSPNRTLDEAARQVRYSFLLKEGAQYHMGVLTVTGFDDKTAERMQKSWRLKSGDVYDTSYPKDFGKKELPEALSGSPAAVRSGRLSMSVRQNANSLTVDVTISISGN